MKKINIAIDGLAGSGKSTVAKNLAKKLGYTYIDTGSMYRCVAYLAIKYNVDYKDDKIRIRSIYSAASSKMFQGEINYPYEKAFERIEQIMNVDENNVTWMPYVARHKAIYEYKICKNIDNAEQILLDTIKLLEVTPLRIKYDIYFECIR